MKTTKRVIPTLKNMRQVYDNYTEEDHLVWEILFDRQIKNLPLAATEAYLAGMGTVGFENGVVPNFETINDKLRTLTGWELVAVEGIVDDELFFELMSNRKFPATTWLRNMEELDYLEEPDMFHDVFAHVPLLANQQFVDFLQALSEIGHKHAGDAYAIELLSRIYWFTVEFGLIRENNALRIYGAGILSSAGETAYSLSSAPTHHEFDVTQILETPFEKDSFQKCYFIIDSYHQLFESIVEIQDKLNEKLKGKLMIN